MPTRAQLEALLQADPEDVFLLYAHAKACASEGDVETALKQFDEVLKRDAKHVPAYFQKAQVLAEEGRTAEAIEVTDCGMIPPPFRVGPAERPPSPRSQRPPPAVPM